MTFNDIRSSDTLECVLTVYEGGSVKDISGATVEASAINPSGTKVAGTATITSAVDGTISVLYSAGDLTLGNWKLQVKVTIASEVQTVSEDKVTVKETAFA